MVDPLRPFDRGNIGCPPLKKREVTGAKRGENEAVLVRMSEPREKGDFFPRRSVFSLDSPFNG